MYRNIFICIGFLILIGACSAKSAKKKIRGEIKDCPVEKVYLAATFGHGLDILDSARVSEDEFEFLLSPDYETGLYRIVLRTGNESRSFPLIIDQEEIVLRTRFAAMINDMEIEYSTENQVYYAFIHQDQKFQKKLNLLTSVLDEYPEENDFYKSAGDEYESVQEQRRNIIEEYEDEYEGLFATRLIRMRKSPFIKARLTGEERTEFLKEQFFDPIRLADTMLLNSDIYRNIILDYLSLYRKPDLSRDQQEKKFVKAVNEILDQAYENQQVFEFALQYITDGFERYQMDYVLNFIAENHLDRLRCEDEKMDENKRLKQRLESFKLLAKGNRAPDFQFTSLGGENVRLEDLKGDYSLIVFWGTFCSHCKRLMPRVDRLYDDYRDQLKVVSVSLDTSKTDYQRFIRRIDADWIFKADYEGWDDPMALRYHIYATPTMIFLAPDLKIIDTPITFRDLKGLLKKHLR